MKRIYAHLLVVALAICCFAPVGILDDAQAYAAEASGAPNVAYVGELQAAQAAQATTVEAQGYYSSSDPIPLLKGRTKKLVPYYEDSPIRWSTSNRSVALVSSKGVVTARKPGKVTIRARSTDGWYDEKFVIGVYQKVMPKTALSKIKALKRTRGYREGRVWTNSNTYFWEMGYTYGAGCYALAAKLSDYAFGKYAPVKAHRSFKLIRYGDHVRLGNSHSVVVIGKKRSSIIVVEGNYNGRIHWGREISYRSMAASGFTVITRY